MTENYPWLKSYPDFVPHTIDEKKYSSIIDIFDKAVSKFGENPAVENMGKTITYNELDRYSDAFAWWIQNKTNLKPGDCIAIQMPNLIQFPIAVFGILKAGLIVVNTNPLYTKEEMKHQFNDLNVKGIVILENFASHLEQILHETQIEHVVLATIGEMLGTIKGAITNFVVRNVKKMVPAYSLPTAISFKQTISNANKPADHYLSLNDTAFLQYTGGTTGVSKGVILTHGNICANMAQVDGWVGSLFTPGKETFYYGFAHVSYFFVNCQLYFGGSSWS
jgi:long-chain acyl-CoA synthetase